MIHETDDAVASVSDMAAAHEAAATDDGTSASESDEPNAPVEKWVGSDSEAPMPRAGPVCLVNSPATSPGAPSSSAAQEGGYLSNRRSGASSPAHSRELPVALRGRNRWAQRALSSTACPPYGVDPAPYWPQSSLPSHGMSLLPIKSLLAVE